MNPSSGLINFLGWLTEDRETIYLYLAIKEIRKIQANNQMKGQVEV